MKAEVEDIVVRVAHSDDIVRAGILEVLREQQGIRVSRGVNSPQMEPDCIVVADYPNAMRILADRRDPKVLVISQVEREFEISSAIKAGAYGYISHRSPITDLVCGIRALSRGSHFMCAVVGGVLAKSFGYETLTMRELDVLKLVAQGMANKSIATELGISVDTVKVHVKRVLAKLRSTCRTQAVTCAVERGVIAYEAQHRQGMSASRA